MAKKKFKMVKKLVKNILEENAVCRDSDMILYITVVKKINPSANNLNFQEVLLNLEELGLPCFETVRRTRQKIQQENPNLRASDIVQDFRTELEMEYRKEFGHE